jgi:ribosome-binding ATPase YchF (GTP1/OBG family)
MDRMAKKVGIIGKPSVGKSTFLNASCGTDAKVADYPFTTIEPNEGVAFLPIPCVCVELGVQCQPRTGTCEGGVRRVPVKLLDVAGLVPGASEGKGLGNQFLGDLADADVLVLVLDISGSLSAEGEPVEPGSRDPSDDLEFLEEEIALWMVGILKKGWDKIARRADSEKTPMADLIADRFSGLKITKGQIQKAIAQDRTLPSQAKDWDEDSFVRFCRKLRSISKPIIIAANKIDKAPGRILYEKLKNKRPDLAIIPTAAGVEVFLQKLRQRGAISYNSTTGQMGMKDASKLSERELAVLKKIQNEILEPLGTTGVDEVLRNAFLDILGLIAVFPVADTANLSDHDGRVLPDVFLMSKGTTARELAAEIHQDLAKSFIHAIDARTKMRLSEGHELEDRDVVKIVSAAK